MPTSASATVAAPAAVRSLSYQELDILHCLRGFCAFYVLVYHAKFILWAGGREYMAQFPRAAWSLVNYVAFAFDMLSSAGYEMVIFFFVLSGFFIRYAQQRKHRAPVAFYLNRIVRIYPPYLASVGLAIAVIFVLTHYLPQIMASAGDRELNKTLLVASTDLQKLNLGGLLRTLFFVPQPSQVYFGYNAVYWSLLPEALFYLAVPLAFWRIRTYYVVSLLFWLLGIVAATVHYPLGNLAAFFLTYNFYFAVGAALYDAVVSTEWLEWFRRVSGWLLGAVLVLLAVVLIPLALLKLKVLSGLAAVLLAVLATSALLAGRVSRRNLVLRAFHPVGVFSFSLYLYHFPLLILCAGLLTAFTGTTVFYPRYYWLAVPLVTAVSFGLYWVTERISVNYFRKV